MPFMQHDPRRLVWQQNDRYLWIEPWGENSLRVRQWPSSAGNEK